MARYADADATEDALLSNLVSASLISCADLAYFLS
jgi:hypothetical protein